MSKALRRGQNGTQNINEAIGSYGVTYTIGGEVPVNISLDTGDASWTDSGTTPNEFYYDTAIPTVHGVIADGVTLAEGTLGALAEGEYAVGDQDTIGADTLYIRLASNADPDTVTALTYSVEESVTVAGQLVDRNGNAVAAAELVTVMISDASTGLGIAATAPDDVVAVTGSIVDSPVAKKLLSIQTTVTGSFSLRIEENGADVWYVNTFVKGEPSVSSAVTFA